MMLSTPTRMNVFLQRMLRKSDDEGETETMMLPNHPPTENSPRKSKWMRKLSGSPIKTKSISREMSDPMVHGTTPMPIQRAATLPTPQEAEDLGKIIQEFEINYLSPTKQMTQQEVETTGKFVKKMVAAFEQKYKSLKESETEATEKLLKRRSLPAVSEQHQEARHNFFNETYVIKPTEVCTTYHEDNLNVSYNPLDETIDISRSSFTTLDLSRTSFLMDEELSSTPVKSEKAPTPVKQVSPPPRDNSRAPKIVGAFLKTPIEVEDTSIDWIPITGKKLPRKHSFKKLLSILTGRKSISKGSKLFCSQSHTNLSEESPKEHHDSGYDEKSSSTSSLTSLVSFSDILHHQENYLSDIDKRTSVSTFHVPKKTEDNPEIGDDFSETSSETSKKLVFEEIPRSEVRLSLGPSFPLKAVIMRQASGSSLGSVGSMTSLASGDIDDFELNSDDTPVASPLPKHPYVSSKDNLDESDDSSQDITQVELRQPSWKFLDNTLYYDTPRSYLSRSEPGMNSSRWSNFEEAHVYDTPVIKLPQRPKSSVYEDALSLKRRNVGAYSGGRASEYYGFQEDEPHYATVKPRNIKILPSKDLLRSMGDLSYNSKGSRYQGYDHLPMF
uniref:Uncharacterized protein n=1 Tax=Fopius arisanus TaxID=64838 RepID=A0A0C9QGN9_9HYME